MDKERAKRIASNSARQAMARRAQRQAVVDASVARKKLAEQGVGEDQYKYYREMDIDSEQKRLEDLQRKQEVFKGFETLVGSGGTLDTPIYDGDTPIYFKDYFSDYDQSLDLSTMEGCKQAITPYDYSSEINKLGKSLDIARLAQSVNLDAKEDFKTYSVANDKAMRALKKERRDSYLTPEEKRRYYYLYNTQGEGAAESYMRALQADLYSRGMQKVYDFADDNGWAGALASVGSVVTSLLSGFEGAANLAAYAADKYIGLNEDAQLRRGYLSDLTQAMRGGASADMGAGGSFIYDTVMSGVDSVLASFVPAGAVMLGLSAASQTSNDILSRGGTGEQALIGGVAAGMFEGFFENFSIGKLKSMDLDEITTSWKSFGKNIGKQVATNAQEEAATEFANIIFDTIAMGDISNAVLSYDRYVAEGMSEEDAKAKVIRDMALQIAEATASGALIGGAFGVGGAGVGAVARAKQGRSIVNDKGTKLNDLIEAGEATFEGDKYKGERELLEAIKANKSKNDVAQRNRVQKLDELLTKEAAERAKNARTWAEQQKAIREAALKDVAGAVDKARGEAENAKIGKDITYTYMPSIANFSGAEGNSIFIEKSDGTTAKLSDLAVEDEELYEAYSLATSTGSVNNANAFIQNYRLHGNNVPVEEFWAAWIGAQNYGQTVTSEGAMEKAIAKYGTDNIPESVLQAAFLSGRNMRTSTTEKYKATQEKYEKAWKDAGGKLTEARFNDNALKGKRLDKSQQEYRSFLRAFSRATGTNIEVFMSEKGARKENGSYNRDTNTLRIDINAGIRNKANYTAMESSIVNTLSHEVVHNMRVTAPELYDALSAFVTETLQADENYNLDEAIEAEIEKGKQKGRDLTREDAIEEIVARACEDRLGSSEKLRDFMIEFYAKDEKAANGFIKAVKEFIARLKSFFENIAKQKSSSEEAQLIAKQSAETIAEIQKRFDEALLAMREGNTARNAAKENRSVAINGTMDMDRSDTLGDTNSIAILRSIGKKSINEFTTEDIKKSELWARRFYRELGVKSPFFRAWFGDWRAYDTSKANHITFSTEINNRVEAEVYIKDGLKKQTLYRGEIINEDSGFLINIGAHIYNDTLTYANRQYSRDNNVTKYIDRISLLSQIADIVKQSVLFDTETVKEESKNDNQLFVHRFYCIAQNNGRSYLVKLTVDELNSNVGSVRRAYNLDNIEISPVAVSQDLSPADTTDDISRDKFSINSISDLFSLVKRYDKNFSPKPVEQMLLNDDGTPKIFYHGTGERFTAFSRDEIADREGSFFFAENKEDAQAYGRNVFEVYLTGKKFADYDNQPLEFYRLRNKRAQVEYLKERGYDGWYADMDSEGWGEVSVFSPTQIKSATDNIGTFDVQNNDIRYQDRNDNYLDAVNRGDMKTAQRLVDEAARKAGYTIKGFHATNADFTVFDVDKTSDINYHGKGIYFTNSQTDVENNYENYEGPDPWNKIEARAYELAYDKYGLSYEDTLTSDNEVIDKLNECYDEAISEFKKSLRRINAYLKFDKPLIIGKNDSVKDYDLSKYDGIIDNNVYENIGHAGMDENTVHYVVFNPRNIKSADTVTYDDNGNVIPLSERFNERNPDIRYQDRIETPEPSEVLRKYFAGNETYEGYKPYVESLKKYRDLMERVENYEKKIEEIDKNIVRLRKAHRQIGKGTRMDDLHKQRQRAEERIKELRNRMFAMEARELRMVVNAETKQAITEIRQKYAARSKERRENASKRQYIESIGKRTKAISELFAKNNAEKHIPDELKAPIADLITALDFSSKRSLSGGDMTQKEEKLKAAVKRITELSALTNGQGLPVLDLPPRFQKEWDAVKEAISVHTWGKGTMYPSQMILENMNSSDLRWLNRSLMDIQHAINVANDVISQANAAPISVLSKDLVKYLDDEVRQRKAQSDNLWQDAKNFFVWENTLPVYAFDRLGGTGRILFESFQNGFDQLVGEVNQIKEYTESAYKFKEVKEWRKQVYEFDCVTLSGKERKIYLTVPQIMSFYCLSKREHAMPHFKGGGIVSEDIKAGKEKYKNDAKGVRLTDETIVKILSTLTERQREVADKLQSFLNTECSAWGNEVSMKRYGIRMFTEQNYFPIETKESTRDKRETNASQNTKMYALLNMSFSKPLTEQASNQIVISDIFEVFADHSNSMARYHSLALPVLDYMKVYNYREKIKSGDETDKSYEQKNVRDSVKNAYGDAGLKYFEEFITGINGANWTQDSNKISAALTKGAKTAMVGFNLRTVVQQPTSAVRALMYLGLDDMTLSLNPTQIKKGHELAVKYCAMAKWKSMGYFDIGTGRGMERMLVGDETWKDKTVEASMYMAGKADELTLAYLWNACERWVSKHDRTLKKNTEEYYKAVGNKLREVIYRSQVVDSPLTRSKFMNSPSEFNKMLAMFGAEPTVTYNMALDVAYKIASAKSRRQAWGEQRRQLTGFIGIYATQALLLAAVQSAMDAIRDDDDEPYGDKYMDEFWTNLLLELEPLSKLPILRDIVSALEGYTTSRIDTTLWSKLSYLFKDAQKLIKGKDVTWYKWVYDILSAASTATGIAASNLVRDLVALWNTIIGEMFPHLKIKK